MNNLISNNKKPAVTTFEEVADRLKKLGEEMEEAKKADLITALEHIGGNSDLIKKIKEKGLPTDIVISSDLFSALCDGFSQYAKVSELPKASEHKQTIVMAWV